MTAPALLACPFCGTAMLQHKACFSHPHPAVGDCILRHYSFDKMKARDWNRRA
jgi:ribosomal protein L32